MLARIAGHGLVNGERIGVDAEVLGLDPGIAGGRSCAGRQARPIGRC